MGQIRVLPKALVNKIAAGEVIERPASVVKELLENAVDAGATRIDVAIEDGGKRLIQVTDNGSGMGREDIALSLAAHATSKLAESEDLFAISTMGFRGEALASVASVSRTRIVSRTADGQGGYEIVSEDGHGEEPRPTAAAVGTTVQVRDLFYNVPARRKFLRGATTEMSHITEQLTRVALARPGVYLTLSHNGRKSLELPGTESLRERIGALFGEELTEELIEARSDERGVGIRALLARPEMSRTSGKWQYFFLNSRYIRDRFVQHAVREAYRGLIEQGRYPVAFVYLEMAPDAVDVNVHPTKIEVRFRDSNTVHSQVLATLREKFLTSDLSNRMRIEPSEGKSGASESRERVQRAVADFFKSGSGSQAALSFGRGGGAGGGGQVGSRPRTQTSQELREELDRLFEEDRGKRRAETESGEMISGQGGAEDAGGIPGKAAPAVIQIHSSYLVTQTPEGLAIVDQHALHERILHEKLSRRLRAGRVASQQLLVPMPIELSTRQQAVLEQADEALRRAGIELVQFGPGTVAVQAFPALLEKADPASVVRDIMDRLADMPNDSAAEQVLEEVVASMACKAAVKAGDKLSEQEMVDLLRQGDLAELASNCPHGRPTILKMSLAELDKQFKRT